MIALLVLALALAGCQGEPGSPTETHFLGTIIGKVWVEESGLPGATVHLSGETVRESTTSQDGTFAFHEVPVGNYLLALVAYPEAVEFSLLSRSLVISEGTDTLRVDFPGSVKRDATIRGTVTVGDEGVGNLILRATGPETASSTTSAGGDYRFSGLKRGTYTLRLSGFDLNTYSFPITARSVDASNGVAMDVDFQGSSVSPDPSGPNLTIPHLSLTQGAQNLKGTVPLVAGRDGFLRVFGLASRPNDLEVAVRAEFYVEGSLIHVEVLPAPSSWVPTSVQEGHLNSSWNTFVPGSMIRPGLEILAALDYDQRVLESDESDNRFPPGGEPATLEVDTTPPFLITFVPVRQSANGSVGHVTPENAGDFLDTARRMLPISETNVAVHSEYVTDAPELEMWDRNGAWSTILSEIDALRVAEGRGRHYYGVVRTTYAGGTVGMSYMSTPTAVGWDQLPNASHIAAHEWGHNWGLWHAPGCDATYTDPSYPYESGSIGVWGFDITNRSLKSPSRYFDFMGYCWPEWVSDYHYRKILQNREVLQAEETGEKTEATLLVWGRVLGSRLILEPSFDVTTVPVLPGGQGPFLLDALGEEDEVLFSTRFQTTPVADAPTPEAHFAFAIPQHVLGGPKLRELRVSGPGLSTPVRTARVEEHEADVLPEVAVLGPSWVEVTWDTSAHAMALIRDPTSGEVLSFSRTGAARMRRRSQEIEVLFSDGLRTRSRVRRAIR